LPIDLQNFVNELQYVPLELSREGENTGELRQMGIHAAIAKNKVESCYEPLALKTIQDGYVQTVRAIINGAVGLHRLRNPFDGYRVRWPDNAKPSVEREALDYEKVDKVFRLGVDSGYLDDAMLGPPMPSLVAPHRNSSVYPRQRFRPQAPRRHRAGERHRL
jgi:hypothetical protein